MTINPELDEFSFSIYIGDETVMWERNKALQDLFI